MNGHKDRGSMNKKQRVASATKVRLLGELK